MIDGGDWVQLGRYVVGLDPLQNTGGPSVTTAVRYYGLIANTLGPLIVIAIPFAVSGVRVNPAVGVSKSIGLFFLYYLLTNFSESLAMNENVGPVVAAWLPNIGMILLAGLFFARLR